MNDLSLIRKNLFRKKLRAGLMMFSILIAFSVFGNPASGPTSAARILVAAAMRSSRRSRARIHSRREIVPSA